MVPEYTWFRPSATRLGHDQMVIFSQFVKNIRILLYNKELSIYSYYYEIK